MKIEYIWCRTVGHAWQEFFPLKKKSTYGTRLSLECVRCSTTRHDIVSWVDGSLLDRNYEYPEDYRMSEKLTRSEFRKLLIRRAKQARKIS